MSKPNNTNNVPATVATATVSPSLIERQKAMRLALSGIRSNVRVSLYEKFPALFNRYAAAQEVMTAHKRMENLATVEKEAKEKKAEMEKRFNSKKTAKKTATIKNTAKTDTKTTA